MKIGDRLLSIDNPGSMFAFLLLFAMGFLVWRLSVLELKVLLLESQLLTYRRSLRLSGRRLMIPETVRRLWVWVFRLCELFGSAWWKQWLVFVKPEAVLQWSRKRYTDSGHGWFAMVAGSVGRRSRMK